DTGPGGPVDGAGPGGGWRPVLRPASPCGDGDGQWPLPVHGDCAGPGHGGRAEEGRALHRHSLMAARMPFGNLFRTVALGLGLVVVSAGGLAAQSRTDTARQPAPGDGVYRVANRGAAFLELGVGARALALGGAFVALGEGPTSLYWNPAGIADIPGIAGAVSHETLYGNSGLTNSFVAVAMPMGAGATGLSVTYFSSGQIERTTERYPEGGDPTAGQYVEWSGLALGASYARQITDRLSFGGTFKFAQEGMSFARAHYYGADFGIRFRTGLYGITLGTALTN